MSRVAGRTACLRIPETHTLWWYVLMDKSRDCWAKRLLLFGANPNQVPTVQMVRVSLDGLPTDSLGCRRSWTLTSRDSGQRDRHVSYESRIQRWEAHLKTCGERSTEPSAGTHTDTPLVQRRCMRHSGELEMLSMRASDMCQHMRTFNCRVQTCVGGSLTRERVKSPWTPQMR